jgi:hypothetical protein
MFGEVKGGTVYYRLQNRDRQLLDQNGEPFIENRKVKFCYPSSSNL